MKKLLLVALVLGSLGIFACDEIDDVTMVDTDQSNQCSQEDANGNCIDSAILDLTNGTV